MKAASGSGMIYEVVNSDQNEPELMNFVNNQNVAPMPLSPENQYNQITTSGSVMTYEVVNSDQNEPEFMSFVNNQNVAPIPLSPENQYNQITTSGSGMTYEVVNSGQNEPEVPMPLPPINGEMPTGFFFGPQTNINQSLNQHDEIPELPIRQYCQL